MCHHHQLARLLLHERVVSDPALQRAQQHPDAEMPYKGAAARLIQVRVPQRARLAPQALLLVLALVRRHDDPVLWRAAVLIVKEIEAVLIAVHSERRAGRQGRWSIGMACAPRALTAWPVQGSPPHAAMLKAHVRDQAYPSHQKNSVGHEWRRDRSFGSCDSRVRLVAETLAQGVREHGRGKGARDTKGQRRQSISPRAFSAVFDHAGKLKARHTCGVPHVGGKFHADCLAHTTAEQPRRGQRESRQAGDALYQAFEECAR